MRTVHLNDYPYGVCVFGDVFSGVCARGVSRGRVYSLPQTQKQTHTPNPEADRPPWTEWLKDRCKNITFPQLRLRVVMKTLYNFVIRA